MRYFTLLAVTLLLSCGQDTPTGTADSPGENRELNRLSAEIDLRPEEAKLYAERAVLYYEAENYDKAIADWTAAIDIDSTNVDYLYELAGAQLFSENYADANRTLNRVVNLAPRDPEAYYLFSRVFAESGDTVRATESAERVLELDPQFTDAYLQLAELVRERGDERAGSLLNTAVNIDPTDVVARYARADYYRDRKNFTRALADYRSISLLDRQETDASYEAGLLQLELDSVAEAYDLFNITVKNDPAFVRAYYQRGYAAELLGNSGQARSDYTTALRMSPDFIEAAAALERVGE